MTTQEPQTPEPKKRVAILVNEETMKDIDFVAMVKRMLEATGVEVVFEDEKEWMARGRVADCDCQLLQCVCTEARKHKPDCRFRIALTCAIPIECEEHKFDVCPTCDPCTCGTPPP